MTTNRAFLIGATDRAVKTVAQTLVVVWGAGTTVLHIPVVTTLTIAVVAAVLSLATSLLSRNIGDTNTTSILKGGH